MPHAMPSAPTVEDLSCPRSPLLLRTLFVAGVALCAAHGIAAQRIGSVSGERVTGSAPSVRAGAIARGPGGERIGGGIYANSTATSRVVTGKIKGYGEKSSFGTLSETAPPGGASSFATNRDFPDTDFVATLPRPAYAPRTPAPGEFGPTLFAPPVTISHAYASSTAGGHYGGASLPASHLKTADDIMSPFTHPIGGSFGTMPSVGLGGAH